LFTIPKPNPPKKLIHIVLSNQAADRWKNKTDEYVTCLAKVNNKQQIKLLQPFHRNNLGELAPEQSAILDFHAVQEVLFTLPLRANPVLSSMA